MQMDDRLGELPERPADHQVLLETAKREIGKVVVGQGDVVESMLIAMLARGHILLEGPPGSAKTLLARALARSVGGYFHRVQFTPQTTAPEILGEVVRRQGAEIFEKGPIFTNVFLADEINRGPARTQAALLEAMQERHVTVRGRTYWIESPFTVIATQNPYEHEGVFALAESQLDRFLAKINVRFGTADEELEILAQPHRGAQTELIGDISPFLSDGRLLRAQERVDEVTMPPELARAIVETVRFTRSAQGVELGASSRAAVHLLAASKARAMLKGRLAVAPEDVRATALLVLPHRIIADSPHRVVREALGTCLPRDGSV